MKALIAAALIAIGSIVVLNDGTEARNTGDEQLHTVDSYLDEGLSADTHERIAEGAEAGTRWIAGLGEQMSSYAE